MKRLSIVAILLALATSASAGEELENAIPVDLARALLDLPSTGELHFYSIEPEGFPEFTVPPGFELLGGMLLPNFSRVALRTEMTPTEGMATLTASLQSDGYLLVPVRPPRARGFIAANSFPTPSNVCHDERGSIQIRALVRGEAHYFSLTGSSAEDTSGATCVEIVAQRQQFIDSVAPTESSGIRGYLPRLTIPEEQNAEYIGFQPPSRFSGTDTGYVVSSVIRSELDTKIIYQHFAEQLRSQQWTQGQELTGSNFHQGEWQFINEDDQLISGALHVEQQDQDNVSLRFTVSTTRDYYIQRPGVPIRIQ